MESRYHLSLTQQALGDFFTPHALRAIQTANLRQDSIWYQLGFHTYFHVDNNDIQRSDQFITSQRQKIYTVLAEGQSVLHAWKAFGRLTHTAQDFYAHTNYVRLWKEITPAQTPPEKIDPLEEKILSSTRLTSGKFYLSEFLVYIPIIGKLFKPLIPRDGHAWLNLDSPKMGPLFDFAYVCALKRTRWEYQSIINHLQNTSSSWLIQTFQGISNSKGV